MKWKTELKEYMYEMMDETYCLDPTEEEEMKKEIVSHLEKRFRLPTLVCEDVLHTIENMNEYRDDHRRVQDYVKDCVRESYPTRRKEGDPEDVRRGSTRHPGRGPVHDRRPVLRPGESPRDEVRNPDRGRWFHLVVGVDLPKGQVGRRPRVSRVPSGDLRPTPDEGVLLRPDLT